MEAGGIYGVEQLQLDTQSRSCVLAGLRNLQMATQCRPYHFIATAGLAEIPDAGPGFS